MVVKIQIFLSKKLWSSNDRKFQDFKGRHLSFTFSPLKPIIFFFLPRECQFTWSSRVYAFEHNAFLNFDSMCNNFWMTFFDCGKLDFEHDFSMQKRGRKKILNLSTFWVHCQAAVVVKFDLKLVVMIIFCKNPVQSHHTHKKWLNQSTFFNLS